MFFLYGAGGHAKVILDILRAQGVAVDCICDDNAAASEFSGLPVLCGSESPTGTTIVAIGKNEVRRKIVAFLEDRGGVNFATAIHPSAVISPSVKIGGGTVIMPGALVNVDTQIGAHSIINTGASVDHDCRIGDFVHIAPHVTLCGNVSVGSNAWVGAGATIIQGISVGENAYIGAGAVVIKDVPANAVVVGVPARVLRFAPPKKNIE
ncbi:MAG: acetyltransferase [Opitutales bacterium]|nr:acetyltransferase [Opitutales bacterium]